MQIYPAIDLREGQCVRLYQGRFDQQTVYDRDPLAVAHRYALGGASWLHLVDLDGAKDESKRQYALIETLVRESGLYVQTGGGIRQKSQIEALLMAGAKRIVIGSQAVREPEQVAEWITHFGAEQIVLALDVKLNVVGEAFVATQGWQILSDQTLAEVIEHFLPAGLRHVLCTDIARDGAMRGPNVDLYRSLIASYPTIQWQGSGGVSGLDDLKTLAKHALSGVIIGRALYENQFTIKEALTCSQNVSSPA